ncbi:Acidic mammalian chitinase [Tolypocladium ophioglossoides CBS 100239]|uniref:Acidic mammalian chitinase n=1 Tax=Tolypocladium ophioglossoides (strain CBS 100239) TaxID=1163406 RepID=A0A0L0N8X9_TOLOC|nr:Acidic mammalian chitinase [Tolypocladium ophioglossoides CBS 100239]
MRAADAGSKFSVEGCPRGNCLRSHVNKTETKLALSMITKAGVQASKVLVGIASYGRSFRMKDPKRTPATARGRPDTWLGDIGQEYKGAIFHKYYDEDSDSNVMVYGRHGKADWVGYMDGQTKKYRVDWIRGLNFGGTTDWAVDLEDPNDTADGKCREADRTWRNITMPDLDHPWPGTQMDSDADLKMYVTIVNLTPYLFKFHSDTSHSYHMRQMDFGDVPPGRARQNLA